MPDHVVERLARVVAGITDRRVRAEQVPWRTATGEPHDDGEHAEYDERPVEEAVARDQSSEAATLDECEEERREENCGRERRRLHACRVREGEEHHEQRDTRAGRALEYEDEDEDEQEEQRIERVLRHDRARVRE